MSQLVGIVGQVGIVALESLVSLVVIQGVVGLVQYDSAEWKPAFLRQAREFLFFPLLPREASK